MKKKPTTWRPPTRRTFVAMLGAAAAALAVGPRVAAAKPIAAPAPAPTTTPARKKTLWIGHC
jgi:hypothetical protein